MSDAWLGFLGGILATLVGALIAIIVQRNHEARLRKEQAQLEVYFHLIELSNWYFWIASAEIHGKEPDPEVVATCRKISFKLSDRLRTFDQVEHLDEALTLLFSESISTANDRANRLSSLIERYGKLVNPRYAAIVSRISRENLLQYGPGKAPRINAPGSWRHPI